MIKKIKNWFIYRKYKMKYNAPVPKFKIGDIVIRSNQTEGEIISMKYQNDLWLYIIRDSEPFENNYSASMGYEFDIDFLLITVSEEDLSHSKSFNRNKKLEELGI